jgi:hypothetical protein
MNKKHIGSNLDDFLREEQLLHTVEATAVKRVIAFPIEREMRRRKLTKTEMANRMKTSRAGLERLLFTRRFYDMVYIYATGRRRLIWYEPKFIWIRLLKRN